MSLVSSQMPLMCAERGLGMPFGVGSANSEAQSVWSELRKTGAVEFKFVKLFPHQQHCLFAYKQALVSWQPKILFPPFKTHLK